MSRLLAHYENVFSITTADGLLQFDAEKICHAVKDVAAPQVHAAINHPEKCFSVLDMSHNVSSTLKDFSGFNKSNPQPAMPQASITGRARLPTMQTFHAFSQSTASQVQGCSSLFVLICCHDCCCIASSASPAASERHMDCRLL